MRITLNMMTGNVLNNLMTSSMKLIEAQDRASSGKRIHKPSDDVTSAGQAMRLRSTLSEIGQFSRNSNIVESQLTITGSTLNSVVTILQVVRARAMSTASGTMTPEGRNAVASELGEMMESLAGLANTQHGGKYILSGSMTDIPAMVKPAGGSPPYVYQGDSVQFTIQVSPGTGATANITGDRVFNTSGDAIPTSPDLFTTIELLRQEIINGDVTAISDRIDHIDAHISNVSSLRSQVGARLQRLESINNSLADSRISIMDLLSRTEDVDLAHAVVELQTRQNLYQAAIVTAGKLLDISLANYLR